MGAGADWFLAGAVYRQFPIRQQFFAVNLDPCLHQTRFAGRQFASQYGPLIEIEYGPLSGVLSAEVGHVVLLVIIEVHANHDAVEHG